MCQTVHCGSQLWLPALFCFIVKTLGAHPKVPVKGNNFTSPPRVLLVYTHLQRWHFVSEQGLTVCWFYIHNYSLGQWGILMTV